jgi:hypothetical protein
MGVYSSITVGNFNRDAYDDLVVGIPCIDPFFDCDGRVYVVFGMVSFPDTLHLASVNPNVTKIYGIPTRDGALGNMVMAGDINGDTYVDLIVSAPHHYPGGQVYIIYGRDTFPAYIYLNLTQAELVRIIDSRPYYATGKSLACMDVDSDGFDDLLLGSPYAIGGSGMATLLFGASDLPDTVFMSDESLGMKRIYGEYTDGNMGWRVAIGHVNADARGDMIIAAHGGSPLGCSSCGEIYVIYGSDSLPDSISAGSTNVAATRVIGTGAVQVFGVEMHCSDVTGDNRDDIIITSWPDEIDSEDVGKVTVVYGSSSMPDTISLGSDSLVTRFYAESRPDDFGRGLGSGDLNGDGVNDLFIGAYRASPLGRAKAGKGYIFYGVDPVSGVPLTPDALLLENYPNPFTSSTTIAYELKTPSPVVITIYNALGQRVGWIERPFEAAGPHRVTWSALDHGRRKIASGIYFCRIQAGRLSQTRKLTVVR